MRATLIDDIRIILYIISPVPEGKLVLNTEDETKYGPLYHDGTTSFQGWTPEAQDRYPKAMREYNKLFACPVAHPAYLPYPSIAFYSKITWNLSPYPTRPMKPGHPVLSSFLAVFTCVLYHLYIILTWYIRP